MLDVIRRHRKVMTVVAGIASATLIGSVAWAYWTGGGAGTGSVKNAGTVSAVVVSQTASIGALSPGSSVPLLGQLTNPNNTEVKVGSLTAEITGVDGGAAISDFSLAGNPVVIDNVVKKGAPLAWSGMTLAYANSSSNQDSGKNATVSIKYTLTPFVENVLPPLGTYQVLTVNGVRMINIYVHMVGTTTILPGDTLSTYDFNVTFGNPAWVDNLATADASGNIRYYAPLGSGHDYQITVKRSGSIIASFPTHLS